MPSPFTDLSERLNVVTTPSRVQPITFYKTTNDIAKADGMLNSLWGVNGIPSRAGAVPSSATTCDRTTNGCLGQVNATGGRKLYLSRFAFGCRGGGFGQPMDRLAHISGLSGTSASTQTISGDLTLPARITDDGIGVRAYIEIKTIIGTTARTVTMAYTDPAGASKTSQAVPIGATGNREVDRFIELQWAAGGNGVKSVQSIILSASTGTAGDIAVVLAKPLGRMVGSQASGMGFLDYSQLPGGEPEVIEDACVMLSVQTANGITTPDVYGMFAVVEK